MVASRSLPSLLILPVLAFFSLSARASLHPLTSSSTATLQLAVKINSAGIKNVAAADRARAQALLQYSGSSSISATNAVVIYTAEVGVGSPPAYYTLLVDTGSSNTWIGASSPYVKTDTSQDTGNSFHIAYGNSNDSTFASGEEYVDTVTLSPDLVIEKQSIGVAAPTNTSGDGLDGILGVGPVDLTKHTISDGEEAPTVMDNLYSQKSISSEVLGVFFSPVSTGDTGGELTFGGYDASKIIGDISYVPITSTSPASRYWGVDQSINYGATSILNKTAGIVDTGTTFILIATDAFNRYQSETGGTLDATTGLLKISPEQYNKLSSLYFNIGGVTYELTPNAQIWPRSLNSDLGGTPDGIYLIISDLGSNSGSGFDFVNGYCFLERFYSVYDTTNSRVGFAETAYTNVTSN